MVFGGLYFSIATYATVAVLSSSCHMVVWRWEVYMSHGIHVYSSSSDIKKWINADLPIMKNDLVSQNVLLSFMGHSYGIGYVHF